MSKSESIGIMNPAFAVPAKVLLTWINDFFKLSVKKVEECSTGAIHCQILDAIFPGQVPLHKVKFDAKHDYEYIDNFKVLQSVFDKQGVQKYVDVPKLIKSKYQDNLEFLQWMKWFFDTRYTPSAEGYDAVARREKAKGGKPSKPAAKPVAAPAPAAAAAAAPAAAAKPAAVAKPKAAVAPPKPAAVPAAAKAAAAPAAVAKPKQVPPSPSASSAAAAAVTANNDALQKENESLNGQLSELRSTIEGLEKERNFYYEKLREIEIMCGEPIDPSLSANDFKDKVLAILYQTDNSEFNAIDDNAQPAEEQNVDNEAATEVVDSGAGDEEGLLDDSEPATY